MHVPFRDVSVVLFFFRAGVPSINYLFVPQLADQCDDLVAPVQSINSSMESLWIVLEDGAELSSCENINGKYQAAVYNELCDELPKGLLGFWVSCTILTILLLILVIIESALCKFFALGVLTDAGGVLRRFHRSASHPLEAVLVHLVWC